MKSKAAGFGLFLFIVFVLFPAKVLLPEELKAVELIAKLRASILAREGTAYPDLFVPAMREQEAAFQRTLGEVYAIERASFFSIKQAAAPKDETRVFLHVVLENDYLAIVQSWELRLEKNGPTWLIAAKTTRDDPGLMYKIQMPSDRVELAALVEIKHQDISLTFRNALVFYDNIPGLETALLVLGQGLVSYEPSDPKERHQLDLAYKTPRVRENINYAFCRFSNSFFTENIRIEGSGAALPPSLPESAKARATTLFKRHYPRFFTVVSSLNRQLLSFLPQGEEAVIEFQTAKRKEFTYIFTPFSEEEIHFIEQPQPRLINLYSPQAPGGLRHMYISFKQKFDVQHYDLEVGFWPQTTWLSVRARVSVLSNIDSLDTLKFRLNQDLEIVGILDQQGRELFYTQDRVRDMLYIYFLESYDQGSFFSFEIHYRGRLVPPDQTTDVLAVGQFGETMILTPPKFDSFLFSRSAAWYPEPAEDDFFTAQQRITVPSGYGCQANGLLLERTEVKGPGREGGLSQAGGVLFNFRTEVPVKYLSFIVGEFEREAEISGPPPLSYFVSSSAFMKKVDISTISDIFHFYEGLFGPYPFPKLAVVQRQWFTGGGHSPASFVVMNEMPRSGDRRLPLNPSSPVDLTRWPEYFLAHEIAHQWWGQGVTWQTFHDQWLSEGLAQFATTQFLRQKYGERTYAGIMERFCQWTDKMSVWGQISLGSRLSFLRFEAYQAVIYNKTSAVLNLLLEVVGAEAFWSGIKNFFKTHCYGAARTIDFVRSLEKTSGRPLGPFFKSWFDSHSLPDTKVILRQVQKGEERFLQADVLQQAEVFVFPLWLEWTEGGIKVNRKVIVEAKESSFSLPCGGRLKDVKVNPLKLVPGRLTVVR